MAFFVLLALLGLPSMLTLIDDPAPGLLTSVESSRRFTCDRVSVEAARRAHPGLIQEAQARGDFIERSAVLCTEPIVGQRNRHPRDAAILGELSATTSGLASRIAAEHPTLTWWVEAHYPDPAVLHKISFATKSALLEGGLQVTDRLPTLAVADIQVISDTPALKAYPLACQRYFATGKLGPQDAILSLVLLDSRETLLHAGTCIGGRWTWLQ